MISHHQIPSWQLIKALICLGFFLIFFTLSFCFGSCSCLLLRRLRIILPDYYQGAKGCKDMMYTVYNSIAVCNIVYIQYIYINMNKQHTKWLHLIAIAAAKFENTPLHDAGGLPVLLPHRNQHVGFCQLTHHWHVPPDVLTMLLSILDSPSCAAYISLNQCKVDS